MRAKVLPLEGGGQGGDRAGLGEEEVGAGIRHRYGSWRSRRDSNFIR